MAKESKSGKSGRDYLPWAGVFLNPDTDPDLFATLPGWCQRHSRYAREQRARGHDPTHAELRRARDGRPTGNAPVTIPSSLTLACLRRHEGGDPPDDYMLATLMLDVNSSTVKQHCTGGGEGTKLAGAKPSGVFGFIWTLTQVRRGEIDSIPLTAFYDLEEGIEASTGAIVSTRGGGTEQLFAWLDGLSAELYAMVP
jgi:hypothetical protein